ncbi:MAG: insulinase family protein [Prevotella sp.]|nr:insulinase family protein [Prevotella sp.]
MIRIKTALAAIATMMVAAVSAQTYHYETVKGDPMQSRIYTLDNGLKIYLSVNKEKPRLQTYIAVRTGSRNDPAETTGLAHYLEHLMFKGTTHFGSSNLQAEAPLLDSIQNRYEAYRRLTDPAARKKAYHEIDSISQLAAQYNIPNEYDKLMASIGSEGSNAYTSNDVTCYVEDIPANEIETWAKIQSDRFKNMVIRGFHTELESVYEEYNIGLTNDGRKSWAALNKLLYPTHPYGTQTTIGTQSHLKNPSIINIKNYYNRYYVPNNVAICMAGDFDPDKVVATIDKYFGDWKKSESLSRPEYAPVRDYTSPVDTTVIGQEAEYVMVGWRTPGAASYQADTLRVIADILSNNKAGLFDVDLNIPMKLQESSAYYEGMHDYGQLVLEAMPKQGQSLETIKGMVLAEVQKLKKGLFADNLLPSVVNNMKLNYYKSLLDNESRANKFVEAFINDQKWEDQVNALGRIGKMTKQQIVDFANRHLTDNYVVVYKRQGTDTTIRKIDKPAITPIPTNNDKQSEFLKEMVNTEATPIQPRFLDFSKDLTKTKVDQNTKVLYKQNTDDDLFTLKFDFPTGLETDNRLSVAGDLMDYAGAGKMTANDIKKAFYALACDYNVQLYGDHTSFTLSGLNENMPAALKLFATLMENAKISKADYNNVVSLIIKGREDRKKSQKDNFNALRNYGIYGAFNPTINQMPAAQMKSADGNALLARLRNVRHLYPMTVMYYGPSQEEDLISLVQKTYPRKAVKAQKTAATNVYTAQPTEKSEVLIAPYDAKNIYMIQYHNENKTWSPDNAAADALFNEYFGGGMNAIVFQELREARGLAYSAAARYVEPWRKNDKEYFYTYIITQSDKMMDCVNEFNSLLNNMPQRQAGFDLAKQSLLKTLSTQRTTRFNVLQAYMDAQDLGLDYDIDQKIYSQLPALKLEDLVKYAADRISNKPYKYLILGDEKNLDLKSLEKIAPIHRVSTKEIFGF